MCGFAFFLNNKKSFSRDFLEVVSNDLFHRGPDSGGIVNDSGMAMVFRRLSILDISDVADQPMKSNCGRETIIFNGEIYNYKEIRNKLIRQGVEFITSGDTEVILNGYLKWGEDILGYLEGMFAFVIVDHQKNIVFSARDPFGIKPMYLVKEGGLLAMSSMIKPLARIVGAEVDDNALYENVIFGWSAGKLSNLKNIYKVMPGTCLWINPETMEIRERQYHDTLKHLQENIKIDFNEAVDIAEEEIIKSVKCHLNSDVGYTVQLSGGVDSSLVTAITARETNKKLESFSINLGNSRHDEGIYREEVVKRYDLEHHEVHFDGADFSEALPRAVEHMEGPVPHMGCVMIMLLCDEIKKSSKVVLTGEGADEFFGGYNRYGIWKKLLYQEILSNIVPKFLLPKIPPFIGIRRFSGRDAAVYSSVYQDINAVTSLFPGLPARKGFREEISEKFSDFRKRLFAVDQKAYLESLLMRQDKMSMSASVESRVPFIHLPLARKINSIDRNVLLAGGETKPLLKKVAEKYLPETVIYRRKVGLTLPYEEWLRNDKFLGRYISLLRDKDCRLAQYSSTSMMNNILDRFLSGKKQGVPDIAKLINVELWLRSLDNYKKINPYVN